MIKFLTKYDSYGQGFSFQIPDHGVHKTALGGLITLLYWIGSLACAIYFGKDLILKENPQFIKENIILDESPYLDLKDSLVQNFTMYFKLVDSAEYNGKDT